VLEMREAAVASKDGTGIYFLSATVTSDTCAAGKGNAGEVSEGEVCAV